MYRCLDSRFRPRVSACLFAGILAVAANGASLGAESANPSPPPASSGTTPKPDVPAGASSPAGAAKPDLKKLVTLVGVTDTEKNDTLAIAAPLGKPLPLILVVKEPPARYESGELRVLSFQSSDQPTTIAMAKFRTDGKAAEFVTVALDRPGQIPFFLEFDRLRPGKTYTGKLALTYTGQTPHQWNITLTTAGLGTLAVDPVGTLKFTTFPPFSWFDGPKGRARSFSFTLRDKSGGGPYSNVNVRFEPSTSVTSKEIKSNFNLDKLTFWEQKSSANKVGSGVDHDQRVDLEGRESGGESVTLAGPRTFTSHVGSLGPGEYSGTLRFAAVGAADDAADSKLSLLIQVRHHCLLPVLVILLGSVVGWLSSKYVVGARKASGLLQQVNNLRADADYLARHSPPRAGWEFPSEANSLGYARVLVSLNRLARLSASTMEVVFHGNEIELALQNAQLRLAALKSVHDVRLRVQPVADGRPAAQLAVGRLLRSANDLLELPTFAEVEKANLGKLVETLEMWANAATFTEAYKQAILARRRGTECPQPSNVAGVSDKAVREQLENLFKDTPTAEVIEAQTGPEELKDSDMKIARLALLWREREHSWAKDGLVEVCQPGKSLDDAFHFVDKNFWQDLADATSQEKEENRVFKIRSSLAGQPKPQAYEIVEMNLESEWSNFNARRILHHPLRVTWRIELKDGQVRTTETDGLTLVQYFPSSGGVAIKASLRWDGKEIPIKSPLKLDVQPNPEYEQRGIFSAEWPEYTAIALAALFSIVTAMGTQYDSTFGTMTQYFALFTWAAGAATGGNLFSQLGTTSAAGGAAATLTK